MFKYVKTIMIINAILGLTVFGTVSYVIYHFVSKNW